MLDSWSLALPVAVLAKTLVNQSSRAWLYGAYLRAGVERPATGAVQTESIWGLTGVLAVGLVRPGEELGQSAVGDPPR